MKKTFVIFFLINSGILSGQEYFKFDKDIVILDNGYIHREIKFSGNKVSSSSLFIPNSKENFLRPGLEFSFSLNNNNINGSSGWKLLSSNPIQDSEEGKGVKIIIQSANNQDSIRLELNYMLYPRLPIIRKWINFINIGNEEVKIEDLNIEDLETSIGFVHSMIYHNYGRMKQIGRFTGTWDDPVVVLHDMAKRHGIAVGNESPGVLKRTAYHTAGDNIEAGLTHTGQNFPFRKWLKQGERWQSPKTFICLYANTDNGFDVINTDVNTFVTRHMNNRIVKIKEKPVFVYNTWNPFRTSISDSLIRDVARAASECGIREFVIDDGWQINIGAESGQKGGNYGDWMVDKKKFPEGLKSTFDYIRSLGMKPGLWISIGSATTDAQVFKEHPEWFVKSSSNKSGNLHTGSDNSNFKSSCLGTDWVDYIKNMILSLVKEYGLAYAKLDFSVITSAYVNNDLISGCYASDHPYHKDHEESYIVIYERLLKLFDDLHAVAPELFIDCTFETAGKLQLMDYAIAQHAEGNWLSNIEQSFPTGPLRVRQLAWWRSPALPAGSLVIGNLPMNEETFEFSLKSLIGTLPIVLGDPRKLTLTRREMIKKWSGWMLKMQEKYDYMSYRKDLPGFGEPAEGSWDGWMRLNAASKTGGIVGIFRQGAIEEHRTVIIPDLVPDKNYIIRLAPEGTEIHSTTGKKLMEKGFDVTLSNKYDGNIYEVGIK